MSWGHVICTFSHSKDNGKFQFLPCAAMRIVILEYCRLHVRRWADVPVVRSHHRVYPPDVLV
jgi:hypothetical protein